MKYRGRFHQWLHREYIDALEKAFSIMTHSQKQEMRDWKAGRG